jgi:DNA-binding MarR family transcriptional regulator
VLQQGPGIARTELSTAVGNQPGKDVAPSHEVVRAFQRFVGAVFRLNGQLLNTAALLSKDLEISTARWQIISVAQHGPKTVAGISRRLGLTRQSVQQSANRLEEQQLVEFIDNPDHRTAPLVRLTARGRKVMDKLADRQARLTGKFTGGLGLTMDEIDELTAQLEHLREHAAQIDPQEIVDDDNLR